MINYQYNGAARVLYETSEHVTAAKLTSAIGSPGFMKWSDIRDTTLGARFKAALERLERMCYAIYGSRPASFGPFIDWQYRLHPRCLWGPEQRAQRWCGGIMPDGTPKCQDYMLEFYEYGAMGSNKFAAPIPTVPIRSQSGDWRTQVLDPNRPHDRTRFPVMSVTRSDGSQIDYHGQQTFDPKGIGYFGGDPGQIGHSSARQYTWEVYIGPVSPSELNPIADADEVEITYVVPAALVSQVTAATVYTNVAGPIGMTQNPPGTWKSKIPGQPHNTLVRWYVGVTFAGQVVYEPGGATPPSTDQQYTYKAFSHWNPYPHGLPELWSFCKKGTDGYTFAGDETIQPELINLARFVLSYIGARFNHSPKNREQLPKCCFDMPIRFRWSGSSPWPLYVSGGKDAESHVHPIHNLDDWHDLGSETARMSWRGAGKLWPSNPEYGPGESWLPIPEQLGIERFAFRDRYSCKIYWRGDDRGLHPGDVIEAAHLEEIIAAVDYLVGEGLWTLRPTKHRVRTPTWQIDGCLCGDYKYSDCTPGPCPPDGRNLMYGCCYQVDGANCIPFTAPVAHDGLTEWQDCWNNQSSDPAAKAPFGKCTIQSEHHHFCYFVNGQLRGASRSKSTLCQWLYIPGSTAFLCEGTTGGGEASGDSFTPDRTDYRKDCMTRNCGWAAYVCGPERCPEGCDSLHGNAIHKTREDYDCNGNNGDAGPSAGNCFSETFSCATLYDTGEHDIGFEAVREVWFHGAGEPWLDYGCDIDCSSAEPDCPNENPPAIPGYPDLRYPNAEDGTPGDLFCSGNCSSDGGEVTCKFNVDNRCMEESVWACIDLKVDGTAPYANHPNHVGDDWMPNLVPYEPNPAAKYTRWTNCPCRTWTGPSSCGNP